MAVKAFDIKDSDKVSKLLGTTTRSAKDAIKADQRTPPKAPLNPNSKIGATGATRFGSAYGADPYKAKPHMDADLTQPGIGEATVSQYLPNFFGPTNSQAVFDAGGFKAPTASEGFYAQNQGAYQTPGAAENWWAQNQGQFVAPGAAENFFAEHKGDLASMPDPTNRAEEAYQAGKARRPDIATDPGLEPYYDEAEARGTRALNKRAAALGNYGSSVALGEVGNLVSGLEAEMANRKADYDLRRIAEQRAWEQMTGEQASSADRSSLGISQTELSQLLGFGNLAQNAQQGSLSRLLGAAGASQGAQGAQTSRLAAGAGAAGQATQGSLGRQNLELNAANSADSQGRANTAAGIDAALAGQGAREGRIGGAKSSLLETIQAMMGVTNPSMDKTIEQDSSFQDAADRLGLAKATELMKQAQASAGGNQQLAMQIFTALVAAAA